MAQQPAEKKILVASQNPEWRAQAITAVKTLSPTAIFYEATTFHEVTTKVDNDPPCTILVEHSSAKVRSTDIVNWVSTSRARLKVAVIIVGEVENADSLMDEVVRGRVQVIDTLAAQVEVSKSLTRSYNFHFGSEQTDFKMHMLADKEVLIKEGEEGRSVYLLKSGRLEAYIEKNGEKIVLGYIEPGEMVGEMSYINGEPRSATVVATATCELVEIPNVKIDHLIFQKPAWMKSLLNSLAKKIKFANQKKAG